MYWNTRIIRHNVTENFTSGDAINEIYYGIHEVYYDEKDSPTQWSTEPIDLTFKSCRDFSDMMNIITEATVRTVLELKTTITQNDEGFNKENGKIIDSGKLLSEFKEEDVDDKA